MDLTKAHAIIGEVLANLANAQSRTMKFYEDNLGYPRMYNDEEKRNAIIQITKIQHRIEAANDSIKRLFDGPFTKEKG